MNKDDFASKAGAVFHKPPHHANCAQSVAIISGREDLISEMAAYGGGRSPGGLCGALHALLSLSPEAKREELIEAFKKEIGATTCREIKGEQKTSCLDCVATASAIFATTNTSN